MIEPLDDLDYSQISDLEDGRYKRRDTKLEFDAAVSRHNAECGIREHDSDYLTELSEIFLSSY